MEAGFLHRPDQSSDNGIVLTHGASSNCNAPLLVAIATEFAARGVLVYRYNLPFRIRRPHGPPSPSTAQADREGIRNAVQLMRSLVKGRALAGGHSYGGRQTSMAAAEDPKLADGLLLLSYPLHPPGKPEQLRTAHLPNLAAPVLFVHGSKDPFGSEAELREAMPKIPAPVDLFLVDGAGHDLGRNPAQLSTAIVDRAAQFLLS